MMNICLEVWGDFALFTRPEFKAERVTYDTITPSAACGLLKSIYWHPGVEYIIDRIHICSPIRYLNIRRNERDAVANVKKARSAMESDNCDLFPPADSSAAQRFNTVLRDVRYVIEARIIMNEAVGKNDTLLKHHAMFERRASRGPYFRQTVFGIRDFPANFKTCEAIPPCPKELEGTFDLGWMLHHLDYSDPGNVKACYFPAVLKNGVLDVSA